MVLEKSKSENIDQMFTSLRAQVERDTKIREQIYVISRELELCEREIVVILDKLHAVGDENVKNALDKCQEITVCRIRPLYEKLKELIQPNIYYKFHDSFRFATQRVVFALAFVHYFTAEKLISLAAVADTIGICSDGKEGFHLDLEDYLFGILLLVTELSRFIVNAVAAGDNRRPFQVADFVRSIDANFRLLNLKNDSLRRKFDTLKYDLQKCDQVVYDLSIRGLRPKNLLDSNPLKTNSDSNDVSASPPKVAKMSED